MTDLHLSAADLVGEHQGTGYAPNPYCSNRSTQGDACGECPGCLEQGRVERYEIVDGVTVSDHVQTHATATRTWSVVAYWGDRCLGGDRHWVAKEYAQAAQFCYEQGILEHARPEHVGERVLRLARGRGWKP